MFSPKETLLIWLLGLVSGVVLSVIEAFLFFGGLFLPSCLPGLGLTLLGYLLIPAISAWIGSCVTQKDDAGLLTGLLTGVSASAASFLAFLIFELSHTKGQLFGPGPVGGLPFVLLLGSLFLSLLGLLLAFVGTSVGTRKRFWQK